MPVSRTAGVFAALRRLTRSFSLSRTAGFASTDGFFERLEQRSLLAGTPLPTLGLLETPTNAVVRFETNLGDIDIEMFSAQAPITVANFLNYVTSGRLDETFFHRSATQTNTSAPPGQPLPSGSPFVVQGGGFYFDDRLTPGLRAVTTDAPIIREDSGRSNVSRTIAMARTNELNSATSQFFFNMDDENTFLDTSGGGYTVFGRVIQGWDVLVTIAGLTRWNLTNNNAFAPENGGEDLRGAMGEVPTTGNFTGADVANANLVYVVNAEIIKPSNFEGFMQFEMTSPDGQRTAGSIETLHLVNPNVDAPAAYQVIARYETGVPRERVIDSGVLSPGASLTLPVSDFNNASLTLVDLNRPYAIVVQSGVGAGAAAERPVAMTFNRFDFGAETSESGFDSSPFTNSSTDRQAWRNWQFARVERSSTSFEFILWVNNTDQVADVIVRFFGAVGEVASRTFTLDPYRRGGIEVFSIGLAPGAYAATVSSTQPIVAMLSDFDVTTNLTPGATPGWALMGVPGTGNSSGLLSLAQNRDGWSSLVSIFNTGGTQTDVTISFIRDGGSTLDIFRSVPAGGRVEVNLGTAGIPATELFGLRFSATTSTVVLQYTALDITNRNQPGAPAADGYATTFTNRVPAYAFFADAGMPSGSASEVISIYNPFDGSAQGGEFSFRLRYHFSDGVTLDTSIFTPTTRGRFDVATADLTNIMNKINSGDQFRRYSISVLGAAVDGSNSVPISGIAEYRRLDGGRAVASMASIFGTVRFLGDAFFENGGDA